MALPAALRRAPAAATEATETTVETLLRELVAEVRALRVDLRERRPAPSLSRSDRAVLARLLPAIAGDKQPPVEAEATVRSALDSSKKGFSSLPEPSKLLGNLVAGRDLNPRPLGYEPNVMGQLRSTLTNSTRFY